VQRQTVHARRPHGIGASLVVLILISMSILRVGAQQLSPAPQQPTQTQSPPTPPAVNAPLPNRVNEVMPAWLRVRGEFRERMEGFNNSGFVDDRDDLYWLSRFRFNATATAGKYISLQGQAQDARVALKTVGPNNAPPFKGAFDLRMAFADVGTAKSPVVLRAGRQELVFGDQRLLGHLGWTNTARTWDAGRVTLKRKAAQVDIFAASLVRILPGEFDKSGNGNRLAGAYAATGALVPRAVVEPYVIWRGDRNVRSELGPLGALNQITSGARVAGQLPARLDYIAEIAAQTGSVGPDSVKAWAGHWQARESLPGSKAVSLTGEYNYASGDSNPADGSRGTIDQLYPTGHDKYGLSDQVGWRNTHHVRAGFELTPIKATPITLNYHSWWLAEKRDGLYAASGALLARVAAGAAGTHVGQELDLQVTRALTPQIQLAGGYAHLFTGPFLRQATPGKSYSQPYLMVTYVLLAER
jgi:hypothetical protein